mmetsp:Transcript_39319/g.155976  ORF Transcript_39319/g.155976 Transcript_39319/m.155976 type:complete len:83 (+) Transcript_39319:570-818(+)
MEFMEVDFEAVELESLDKGTLQSLAVSADRDIEEKIGEYYAKRAESIRSKKLEKEAEAIPSEDLGDSAKTLPRASCSLYSSF